MSEEIYEITKDADGVDCYIKRGELVRCKDCAYCEQYAINTGEDYMTGIWCGLNQKDTTLQDFCSCGEREGGDDE